MNNQEEYKFTIFYDSEDGDLKQHRLSAGEYAKAINALNKLFMDADRILYPKKKTIDLYITTPAVKGSLGAEFVAYLNDPAAHELIKAFGIMTPIATTMGSMTKSLFEIAKEIKDFRRIEVEYTDEENSKEKAIVKVGDKNIPITPEVAKLIERPNIRKGIYDVIAAPVESLTNPSFSIGTSDKREIYISFDTKEINRIKGLVNTETAPKEYNFETTAIFTTINFNKKDWKMKFQDQTVKVTIEDQEFLTRVEKAQETFSNQEEYTVQVTRIQTFDNQGKEQYKYIAKHIEKKRH